MRKQLLLTSALGEEEPPEFQLAPMIDVIFQLLVFFICATTIGQIRYKRGVELPIASRAEQQDKTERAIIDLQWLGPKQFPKISVNAQEMTLDQVTPFLKKLYASHPDIQVLLRADRNVRYHQLRDVMTASSAAGLSKIAFAAVPSERKIPGQTGSSP